MTQMKPRPAFYTNLFTLYANHRCLSTDGSCLIFIEKNNSFNNRIFCFHYAKCF